MINQQTQKTDNTKGADVFHIIVNTREKEVRQEVLTFDEITKIAYPNPDGVNDPIFTVSFKNADQKPSDGTLVSGESVKIKNGTIFNVKRTGRS